MIKHNFQPVAGQPPFLLDGPAVVWDGVTTVLGLLGPAPPRA